VRERQDAERIAAELQPELEVLHRLGLTLAGQLDMERLVQAVTDAGIAITGAAFGAFLYRDASGAWSHFVLGAPRDAFVDLALPNDADAVGAPIPPGVSRSDDLTRDPRHGVRCLGLTL
jgi:GAF domain-containing protein